MICTKGMREYKTEAIKKRGWKGQGVRDYAGWSAPVQHRDDVPIYTEEGEELQWSLRMTVNPEQQTRFETRTQAAAHCAARALKINLNQLCFVVWSHFFCLSPHFTYINLRGHVNNMESG